MANSNGERRITYSEIARVLGISRERVRQIANRQRLNRQSKVTISSKINEVANRRNMNTRLTTREVATLLNVHINTVRQWSNQGMLRAYRVSPRGDRRFKRQDIDNFLLEKPRANRSQSYKDNHALSQNVPWVTGLFLGRTIDSFQFGFSLANLCLKLRELFCCLFKTTYGLIMAYTIMFFNPDKLKSLLNKTRIPSFLTDLY